MLGIFSKTNDSNFIEAAGLSGLDFIILDQEHGSVTNDRLFDHIRAAHVTSMKAIVRVKELNHNEIGSALDAGADGVQIPNISTPEEAKMAIEAARFFPLGKRGICRFVKAANYGLKDRNEYFTSENTKLIVLQVEGQKGIDNIDEILLIPGFDILFVGPYDLSQSLGIPGQINHPILINNLREVARKATAKKIRLGTFSDNIQHAKLMRDIGFKYIAFSVDINLFSVACNNLLNDLS